LVVPPDGVAAVEVGAALGVMLGVAAEVRPVDPIRSTSSATSPVNSLHDRAASSDRPPTR
jgi:hypothetical protein